MSSTFLKFHSLSIPLMPVILAIINFTYVDKRVCEVRMEGSWCVLGVGEGEPEAERRLTGKEVGEVCTDQMGWLDVDHTYQ